jgi:KUP system potassium uptake protein
MSVLHTSEGVHGQIYVPLINWTMLATIVVLVLGFQSSSSLAAAYGISVTATMLIDLSLAALVALLLARWHPVLVAAIFVVLFTVDLAFFAANVTKIAHGGWFPLALGFAIFTLMMTWKRGRDLLRERTREQAFPLEPFVRNLIEFPPHRVEGTAVFMNSSTTTVPTAMLHNLKHNKVLHQRVVFLTVRTRDEPYVDDDERVSVDTLGGNFWRVSAQYGFMESPNVPALLELCAARGLEFEMMETSFFLGRESIVVLGIEGMGAWRERLYSLMQRNALKATDFFRIPPNRVVELGTQVEI